MLRDIFLCPLDGTQMVFLLSCLNDTAGLIVSDVAQHCMDNLHYQLIELQLADRLVQRQLNQVKVQELGLRIGFDEGGMPVIIGQEPQASTMRQQPLVESWGELHDRALIRHGMGMGHGTLVARLRDQHTAVVGVKGMAEDMEEKVPSAHETDAKGTAVFRLGGAAIDTPAFKVENAVKVRTVQGMDIGLHKRINLLIFPAFPPPASDNQSRCAD